MLTFRQVSGGTKTIQPDFHTTLERFVSEIVAQDTGPGLFDYFDAQVRSLGFDYYSLGVLPLDPKLGKAPILHGTFPNAYVESYVEIEGHKHDPFLEAVATRVVPFLQEEVQSQVPDTKGTRQLLDVGNSFNLRNGFMVPLPTTGVARGVGFWALGPRVRFDRIVGAYWHQLHIMAAHFASAAETFGLFPAPEGDIDLSPRERDCLRWVGLGFTGDEVAERMNISERTVRFHLKNACNKLDAERRTEAVVRALRLGLIEL